MDRVGSACQRTCGRVALPVHLSAAWIPSPPILALLGSSAGQLPPLGAISQSSGQRAVQRKIMQHAALQSAVTSGKGTIRLEKTPPIPSCYTAASTRT